MRTKTTVAIQRRAATAAPALTPPQNRIESVSEYFVCVLLVWDRLPRLEASVCGTQIMATVADSARECASA